ncbi:MAG: methyltransferase domain-containing protein [Roseiarcus sp.]
MDNRFSLPEDARADLVAFKQRIEELDFEHPSLREGLTPPRPRIVQQSLWGKFNSLLISLFRLTDTRRRVEAFEDEAANFRQVVMAVVGSEFTKAVAHVVEQEIAKLYRVIDQRAADNTGALEQESALLRDKVQQESALLRDMHQQESALLRNELQQESALLRDKLREAKDKLRQEHAQLKEQTTNLEQAVRVERLTRQKAFTDFDRQLTLKGAPVPVPAPDVTDSVPANAADVNEEKVPASQLTSVQSTLETFYYRLEERYRGTRDEIKRSLLIYRNDFRAARERTGVSGPVVDIGCGRGEFLEVLGQDNFLAIGVDSNVIQLDSARRHGAAVVHADALEYLRGIEDESVLAVTGIHVVEHIPFPDLVCLMQQVIRVLKKGGIALFETPNPRNLIVGATTFYLDPTHIRQLPPEVMKVLFETVGFEQIEIRPLHPSDTLDYMIKTHNLDPHIGMLLFGPQDYAVIGVVGTH